MDIKKKLFPSVVDPDVDLAPDEDYMQRQQSEAFAFSPIHKSRMNLDLTDAERKASLPWLLNVLENGPNVHVLADVLRCIVLKEPFWNVQAYQALVSQMRFDKAMAEERELQTREWNGFINKPIVFSMPGYVVELASDKRDVKITGQPGFAVKVSNGKQSAVVQFSTKALDFWRRKVTSEVERFKAAYGTEAEQLGLFVMDLPDGIEVTLVRDARETMRPLKTEDGTSIGVEPDLKIGEVLAPVTVLLQLLAKKRA